jgi:hypothetical protein
MISGTGDAISDLKTMLYDLFLIVSIILDLKRLHTSSFRSLSISLKTGC